MNVKKKARRVMSGLLTAVTVLSTVLSPAVAYASDDAGSVKKIPYYEEIKDQLDEDEVVTAKDYEIKVGDNFDVKSDYTGLTIQDDSKVKVTFQEAKDTDGNDFSTDYANSYKAVYYVEPQNLSGHPYPFEYKFLRPHTFPSGSNRFRICGAAWLLPQISGYTWNKFHLQSADAQSTDNHRTTFLLLQNSSHIFHRGQISPAL